MTLTDAMLASMFVSRAMVLAVLTKCDLEIEASTKLYKHTYKRIHALETLILMTIMLIA